MKRTTMKRFGAALALLLTACLALVAVAPGASAAGFAVRDLSVGPVTIDATSAPAVLKVRTRLVRATKITGAQIMAQIVVPAGSTLPLNEFGTLWSSLTQVSGTDTDGVFEGTLALPAGVQARWDLFVGVGNSEDAEVWNPTQLRAAGLVDHVTTVVTKAPAALTNLNGRTITSAYSTIYGPVLTQSAVVTYKLAPGPSTAWVELVGATPACGDQTQTQRYRQTGYGLAVAIPARKVGLCTVRLRAVNSAGVGPTVSTTFL